MNVRLVTLWLYLLAAISGAAGALTTFLDSFGQAAYVSYILLGVGVAATLTTQILHIFDVSSGPLDPGTIRLLTVLNLLLGALYAAGGTVVAALPPTGRLGRLSGAVVLGAGFFQAVIAGVLHQVDVNRSANPAIPGNNVAPVVPPVVPVAVAGPPATLPA